VKTRVFDLGAILVWISGRHPASDAVANLLVESEVGVIRLFMNAINLGQVYSCLPKQHSEALGESWRELSTTLPATIDVPTVDEIWDAALLKGQYPMPMQTHSPRRWRRTSIALC